MIREIQAAHDHLFKLMMEQPRISRALLRERLPPSVVARLDDGDPVLFPGDLVNETLRELNPDRVLAAAGHYILDRWTPITREDLAEALRLVMSEKEELMVSKAAQAFIAEGVIEGLQQGLEQGRAEGEPRQRLECCFGCSNRSSARLPMR